MDRSQNPQVIQPGQETLQNQRPPVKPSLTAEELQVLRECNRESFLYRCVPFGVIFIGTTQALINRGHLKAHPKYGSIPKNMAAGLLAYFVGKISYQDQCRQKILQLENSPLADSLRGGKKTEGDNLSVPSYGSFGPSTPQPRAARIQEDYSSKDFDTESNVAYKGLDDSKRPSADSVGQVQTEQSQSNQFVSYDDLRKQNRIDYETKRFTNRSSAQQSPPNNTGNFPSVEPSSGIRASDTFSSPTTSDETRRRTEPEANRPSQRVRRNQYGDIIEE